MQATIEYHIKFPGLSEHRLGLHVNRDNLAPLYVGGSNCCLALDVSHGKYRGVSILSFLHVSCSLRDVGLKKRSQR